MDFKIVHVTNAKHIGTIRLEPFGELEGGLPIFSLNILTESQKLKNIYGAKPQRKKAKTSSLIMDELNT